MGVEQQGKEGRKEGRKEGEMERWRKGEDLLFGLRRSEDPGVPLSLLVTVVAVDTHTHIKHIVLAQH